jgi:hypothetical protein
MECSDEDIDHDSDGDDGDDDSDFDDDASNADREDDRDDHCMEYIDDDSGVDNDSIDGRSFPTVTSGTATTTATRGATDGEICDS